MKKKNVLTKLSLLLIFLSFIFISLGVYTLFFKHYDNSNLLIFTPTKDKSVSHIDNNQFNNKTTNNNDIYIPDITVTGNFTNENLNKIRNSIESKYNINILYGNETDGYNVGGMQISSINNLNVINKYLLLLDNCLSKYPINFFTEMKNNKFPLNIYFIRNYSKNNVTGVTESYKHNTNISIVLDSSFSDSLHHEIFHYTENYMNYIMNAKYSKWDDLNPSFFSYGSIDSSMSYNRMFSENSFFVNDYAQTDPCEDRASTFEYMMSETKASCLNKNMPIWKKAKYMSENLDIYYTSVSSNVVEYWERYL